MMLHQPLSDTVPFRRLDRVEQPSQGKTVENVWLRLEGRHGPTPARHIVSIETKDGAVYRFQRYSRQEYLAFYNRENPDGSEFERKAPLPENVEAVREAIMDLTVCPDFEALYQAEQQVAGNQEAAGLQLQRADDAVIRSGVATDGGQVEEGNEQ